MKQILCFSLMFFLFSCQTERDAQEILLFNGIKFSLIEGEHRSELTSKSSDLFRSYIADIPFQIPLYLNIEDSSHRIFVGLPLNTTLRSFLNFKKRQTNVPFQHLEADSVSYIFNKRKEKDVYISEYVFDSNNSLLFVLALTKSKSVSDSLFNYHNMSRRIKTD